MKCIPAGSSVEASVMRMWERQLTEVVKDSDECLFQLFWPSTLYQCTRSLWYMAYAYVCLLTPWSSTWCSRLHSMMELTPSRTWCIEICLLVVLRVNQNFTKSLREGSQIPTFILFFILASKWSETSRNAKKIFSLCEGGVAEGGRGGSEDQICGNILSIFNFSRGKIIFF